MSSPFCPVKESAVPITQLVACFSSRIRPWAAQNDGTRIENSVFMVIIRKLWSVRRFLPSS